MSSSLFNYKMTGSRVYVALQNFEITNRIQISFIFYIIGEWGVNKYIQIIGWVSCQYINIWIKYIK